MPRAALLVLALLVAGIACFVWLGGTERTRAALADEAPEAATTADAPVELHALALAAEPSEAEPAASSHRTSMPDERARIAGRVCPPGGYPADESACILAEVYVGQENRGRPLNVRADVARDGAFEVLVPKDARYALLDLESEDLYLAEAVKARPGDVCVRIEPQLLARLSVRVVAPPGVEADMKRVQLSCWARDEAIPPERNLVSFQPDSSSRPVFHGQPLADGSFQFAFAVVGDDLELRAESPWGPDWRQTLPALAPGERREVMIALDRGFTIAGRVIDEQGAPVGGVLVSAQELVKASSGGAMWFGTSETNSREDGGFELRGLEHRNWRVAASDMSLAEGAELSVDGTAGDVRGLVLSVVRGECIEGTVVWADGSPAEIFSVSAGGAWREFTSGRFTLKGLRDDAQELRVTADKDTVRGTAQLSGVRPGQPVRVVLESSAVFQVQGRVTDSTGRPVETFDARVRRGGGITRHQEGGRFVLGGLDAGPCEIEIVAPGYQAARQQVEVGPSTPALAFGLLAAGRVRGTVLDAHGNAVANASVEADWGERRRGSGSARTDSLGRFELEVGSVALHLHASCAGHGASEVLDLWVESGRTLEGVVLALRDPCRLEGRVLDADGKPVAGAYVRAGSDASTQSDERGEFSLDSLAPGRAEVFAVQRSVAGIAHSRASVVLAIDQPTTVELRLDRPDSVRIRGRILRGGQPLTGAILFLSNGDLGNALADADGRFEATLRRPGEWSCVIYPRQEGSLGHTQRLVVPDVDVYELELDYDAMREIGLDERIDR